MNAVVTACPTGSTNVYATKSYLSRYCIPTDTASTTYKTIMNNIGGDALSKYMGDLITCWWVLLVVAGAAFLYGFVYMFFLKCCAKVLVWVSIFACFLALLGGGAYFWQTRDNYEKEDSNYDYMTYGAYTLWGLAAFYFILILCCCNRIRLGLAVI